MNFKRFSECDFDTTTYKDLVMYPLLDIIKNYDNNLSFNIEEIIVDLLNNIENIENNYKSEIFELEGDIEELEDKLASYENDWDNN